MRLLLALVLASLGCAGAQPRAAEAEPFSHSAVKVHVNGSWNGTGFVVHQNRRAGHAVVVTAAHVVLPEADEGGELHVSQERPDGTLVVAAAQVVRVDAGRDLAMLMTRALWVGVAPVCARSDLAELRVGSEAALFGFSAEHPEGHLYAGAVTALRGPLLDLWPAGNLVYDVAVAPGTSGSAVWARLGGRWLVVSVNQGGYVEHGDEGRRNVAPSLGAAPEELQDFLFPPPPPEGATPP